MSPDDPRAFAEARAAVAALLGPPDATESTTTQPTATVARWGVRGVSLTVRAYHDAPSVVLVAERLDGDAREWRAIGDGTVRDACAWLGWTVPRATLPGLAPVGYDGDGRLTAGDDGCGLVFADPTDDAK